MTSALGLHNLTSGAARQKMIITYFPQFICIRCELTKSVSSLMRVSRRHVIGFSSTSSSILSPNIVQVTGGEGVYEMCQQFPQPEMDI
jgi:hypothetical protein